MTVTSVRKDPQTLTMTLQAEFDAPAERIWQLWADPRQIERWWGPPTYPATFTRHDLAPGGRAEYHMTGPDGDKSHGYWEVLEAQAPHRLVFRDGFANDDGTPNNGMPINHRPRSASKRSARAARACGSRAPSPAPRPWSRSSAWAWKRA